MADITSVEWRDIYPDNPFLLDRTVDTTTFKIRGNSEKYVDLSRSYLAFKAEYRRGSNLDQDPYFVNNILHSYWNRVEITIGGKRFTQNDYAYTSFFNTLCFSSFGAQHSQAVCQGFVPPESTDNVKLRKALLNSDFQVVGRLALDVCGQSRLILNNTPLEITLHPNNRPFIVKNADGVIVPVELKYRVCLVNITDRKRKEMEAMLLKTPALYPYEETLVKVFDYTGPLETFNDLFENKVPKRALIVLLEKGVYEGNGFKDSFDALGITEAIVDIDGTQEIKQARGYSPFTCIDEDNRWNYGNCTRYLEYKPSTDLKKDYPVLGFDFDGRHGDNKTLNLTVRQRNSLSGKLLCIGYFSNHFAIDHTRRVI